MSDVDPIDKLLGNNLRFLRLMRGLTQTDLGNILNVTFQQVQKYEQGSNRISARTLCILKTALRVEYQDFFNPVLEYPLPTIDAAQDKVIISAIRYLMALPTLRKKRAVVAIIRELGRD